MSDVAPTTAPAPVTSLKLADRHLAPDIARGLMLLLIAVANVWTYLTEGRLLGFGYRPADATTVDQAVNGVVAFAVDDRARPLFAILYGFGMAVMARRLNGRGLSRADVSRVLRRRSFGLFLLGLAHVALLFAGDILTQYGVTGLIAIVLVRLSTKALGVWLGVSVVLYAGIGVAQGWGDSTTVGTVLQPAPTYLASMLERVLNGLLLSALTAVFLVFVSQVVIGILVERAGWLARPAEHRTALRRCVAVAAITNLTAATPYALAVAGVWQPEASVFILARTLHWTSGVIVGLGYLAFFALLADRWQRGRPGSGARALAATGRRSLTCYLAQSAIFAPLLSAWGLGWGLRWGTAQATVLAIGVWAITVAGALLMERRGRRGPFESGLRRFAYRPRSSSRLRRRATPTPRPAPAPPQM